MYASLNRVRLRLGYVLLERGREWFKARLVKEDTAIGQRPPRYTNARWFTRATCRYPIAEINFCRSPDGVHFAEGRRGYKLLAVPARDPNGVAYKLQLLFASRSRLPFRHLQLHIRADLSISLSVGYTSDPHTAAKKGTTVWKGCTVRDICYSPICSATIPGRGHGTNSC